MAVEGAKDGLVAALEVLGAAPEVPAGAEQLALLPDAVTGEAGSSGRPKGARNRRTQEWVDYLLARHRAPLEALAEVLTQGPEALRAELGCERLEAFDRWLRVAEALLPYLHQKQPMAIQADGGSVLPIVLGVTAEGARAMGVDPRGSTVIEIVSDQSVSAVDAS